MKHRLICILYLLIFCFLFQGTVSLANDTGESKRKEDCFSTAWPHEVSELKPDPALKFGRFPNGFRYVLMENHEPQNRVGLYLNIQAGSLHETDEQRGLAHYLEHMVFNGSTHFKPGELVGYFQSIGMDFGGDANAHTAYDETVYKVILPSGTEEQIDKGLLVLADYARGAFLLESEIERERGVILAEKRTRDSASYRMHVESSKFSLQGTRLPLRQPIGTKETIKKANHDLLKDYYDAWYRPSNMILVVVGDIDMTIVEPVIRKHFEMLQGNGPEPECPDFGRLVKKGRHVFYFNEPELGATNVSIETLWQKEKTDDSFGLQLKNIREHIVSRLVNLRLEQTMESADAPFTESLFYSGDLLDLIKYSGIYAKTSPEKWQEALQRIQIVLQQALQYGFNQEELDIVKKELISYLASEVSTVSTRDSQKLSRRIIQSLNKNRVLQSPQQEWDLFETYIQNLTLADIVSTLKGLWSRDNLIVEVTGNVNLDKEPEKKIEKFFDDISKSEVKPWIDTEKVVFPYLAFTQKYSKPITSLPLDEIGGERFILDSGIVINIKKTAFKKEHIDVRIDIDGGRLSEPHPGMALLAESIVRDSGSSRLKKSELARVLAGSTVDYDFKVKQSYFSWHGSALRPDLELLFQILQTVVVDPGLREEVYGSVKESYRQSYRQLERSVNGGMRFHVKSFLAGGNSTFGWPLWEIFSGIQYQDLKKWILEELYSGPIEITIVGDFDREELVDLCKKYMGGLKKRDNSTQQKDTISFPKGEFLQKKIKSSIDKSLVVLAWPTADFWNINRTRRLNVLAKIFDDRLRVVIREKMGAAYSPVVYNFSSRTFKDYGYLVAQMIVEPGNVDNIRKAVLEIGSMLHKNGITKDELERAKAPMVTSIKDMVRTNGYWMNSVLAQSSRHPLQLKWPHTILSDYEGIKVEEVNELAQQYLHPEHVATAMIMPE